MESRTVFFLTCYPLLLTVQGIDLPLGIEKMKGICPDNLRGQEHNHWNHNNLKSAYWFQRMLVMLIPRLWIFYLNWFFFLSHYCHANLTHRVAPHMSLIYNWKDLKMAFSFLRWKALFEMVPENAILSPLTIPWRKCTMVLTILMMTRYFYITCLQENRKSPYFFLYHFQVQVWSFIRKACHTPVLQFFKWINC